MIESNCWKEKLAIKNILSEFYFRNKGEKTEPETKGSTKISRIGQRKIACVWVEWVDWN